MTLAWSSTVPCRRVCSAAIQCRACQGVAANDWRSRSKDFSGEQLTQYLRSPRRSSRSRLAMAPALRPWRSPGPGLAGGHGCYCRARSPEQVDGWLDAARLELNEADLQRSPRRSHAPGRRRPAIPVR